MKLARVRLAAAAAAIALVLVSAAVGQTPEPPSSGAAAETAAVAPRPVGDVIRLFKAGLSEDFILRKIARDGLDYRLSTDDIIACKDAGLPETIIEAMLKSSPKAAPPVSTPPPPVPTPSPEPAKAPAAVVAAGTPSVEPPPLPAPAPSPAPAAPAAVAPAVVPMGEGVAVPAPPAPAPTPTAPPIPTAPPAPPPAAAPFPLPARSWEGLVHRDPGVVLFQDPWNPGTLSFRDGTLSWVDPVDGTRNVSVPVAVLLEQFLLCPKESDFDGACWEWGFKTADSEHRFRDASWARDNSPKPSEIFEFVKGMRPSLPVARYRAPKKK